jgi:hypothetical protein
MRKPDGGASPADKAMLGGMSDSRAQTGPAYAGDIHISHAFRAIGAAANLPDGRGRLLQKSETCAIRFQETESTAWRAPREEGRRMGGMVPDHNLSGRRGKQKEIPFFRL